MISAIVCSLGVVLFWHKYGGVGILILFCIRKKLLIAEGVQTLQGFAMNCCGGQLQNTGKYLKREEFSIELSARFLPIVLIQAGG